MGSFSLWHWLVVIILVLLLFGRGRISDLMGDLGKGLKSFKQGMADDDGKTKPAEPRQLSQEQRPIDITPKQATEAPPPPPTGDETPRS